MNPPPGVSSELWAKFTNQTNPNSENTSKSGKIDMTGWSPEQIIEYELSQSGVPAIKDNSVQVMLIVAGMLLMLIAAIWLIKKGRGKQ